MEPLAKLLVISFDAGDKDLIEKWIDDGSLPNLGKLKSESAWGFVDNPRLLEAGSVWPTFHSGAMPGRQPMYDGLRRFDSKSYGFTWFRRGEDFPEPFWGKLSKAGKRVAVIDAPYTLLDSSINGINVVDYGSHVPSGGDGDMMPASHPPEIMQELLEAVGPDPTGGVMCDNQLPETHAEYCSFRDRFIERAHRKAKASVHILKKGGWDYFQTSFMEAHCVGHQLWHVNDKQHPRYDAKLEAAVGEPLKETYIALDQGVGEILSCIDDRTTVLLFTSHGMRSQYSASGLLDRILLHLETGSHGDEGFDFKQALRSTWRKMPAGLRSTLGPLRNQMGGLQVREPFAGNRENRRFFEVPANNATGGVRVNLVGREAAGLVNPSEYEDLLDWLESGLSKVRIVETGEPLIKEIARSQNIHPGPCADRLPDLLVNWNNKAPIGSVFSPDIGEIRHTFSPDRRTGDHLPTGMFLARGPNITRGLLNKHVDVIDFAPTIASFLGNDNVAFDGNPISAILGGARASNEQ
jgi:predicted AlkP superfamily phosphohydrolase/phosphomutase